MVQGLAFLSKKSWHTKNLVNQEKVWMAEQQKAAEETKTKELAKQIQQEREEEELDKIAGKKSYKKDRGIDWMYQEGGDTVKEDEIKKQEEYLLGKEYVAPNQKVGDFANLEDQGGVNAVIASVPVAASAPPPESHYVNTEPTVADRNEAFRMRHEDPMFAVSSKQREKQTQHDKKRALYERVVGPTDDEPREEDGGRSKKERKKRKHRHCDEKIHRKTRRHRSRSRSGSRSSSRDHHRRRHSRRSPSEERSLDYNREKDRRHRRRDRSSSPSQERKRRYRSRSPRDCSGRERPGDYDKRGDRDGEYHYNREPSSPRHREEDRPSRPSGYGLQGKTASRHDDLGPNRELLDQKKRERDEERRRIRETASSRRTKTDQERAVALEAMQRDASKRDQLLHERKTSRHNDGEHAPSSGKASFLQEMAERTHGIREGGSLASRVAQNRHSNQKLTDSFF
jgi:hypothetical protein